MHTCMYALTHTHTHACTHVHAHTHTHAYAYMDTPTTHTYTYTHVHLYIYMYMFTHAPTHRHTSILERRSTRFLLKLQHSVLHGTQRDTCLHTHVMIRHVIIT